MSTHTLKYHLYTHPHTLSIRTSSLPLVTDHMRTSSLPVVTSHMRTSSLPLVTGHIKTIITTSSHWSRMNPITTSSHWSQENLITTSSHWSRKNLITTVGVKKKYRIPFRRTAFAKLKNGQKTVRRLLKNGRSVRPHYRFNLSRSLYVSLKEI